MSSSHRTEPDRDPYGVTRDGGERRVALCQATQPIATRPTPDRRCTLPLGHAGEHDYGRPA